MSKSDSSTTIYHYFVIILLFYITILCVIFSILCINPASIFILLILLLTVFYTFFTAKNILKNPENNLCGQHKYPSGQQKSNSSDRMSCKHSASFSIKSLILTPGRILAISGRIDPCRHISQTRVFLHTLPSLCVLLLLYDAD